MIRTYSQRLMPPYTGQVQIAELGRARAITLDGKNWEIQFLPTTDASEYRQQKFHGDPVQRSYVRVASLRDGMLARMPLPSVFAGSGIDTLVERLAEYLADAVVPFPAADHFEYWLLDGKDESPLALIHACVAAEDMASYPLRAEWTALPASMMPVEPTAEELEVYTPPVNYRLERLVAERAGKRPKAVWIDRRRTRILDFPACMVREEWEDSADAALCRRYINRQAPRLLMLHSLGLEDRLRLELAARANALEVGRFSPLYPEVADQQLMSAIRVEATLRRASAE